MIDTDLPNTVEFDTANWTADQWDRFVKAGTIDAANEGWAPRRKLSWCPSFRGVVLSLTVAVGVVLWFIVVGHVLRWLAACCQ